MNKEYQTGLGNLQSPCEKKKPDLDSHGRYFFDELVVDGIDSCLRESLRF